MGKKQQAKVRDARTASRQAYTPPELKEFGPVGVLTQAGRSGDPEMGMGPGMGMGMGQEMFRL